MAPAVGTHACCRCCERCDLCPPCCVAVDSSVRVRTTRQRSVFIAQDHPVTTSSAQLCETCRLIEAREPHQRRLAEWAHLDITDQHLAAAAPQQGLVLIAQPPATGTPTGRIELVLDGAVVGIPAYRWTASLSDGAIARAFRARIPRIRKQVRCASTDNPTPENLESTRPPQPRAAVSPDPRLENPRLPSAWNRRARRAARRGQGDGSAGDRATGR
jgi:hypothetical protein